MTRTMKFPIALVCTALALQSARAENLSDADREALLDNLEKLREAAVSKIEGKFRVALAAYRNAMSGDDQAIELYLNCVEKVDYSDQQKKAQDFREWKRREADRLADPDFRRALRVQLAWLILTLQAAAEKPDPDKLAKDAQEIMDSIFRDPEKLATHQQLVGQPVLSTHFARAYEITRIKLEKWPLSPLQLGEIYNQIILPPLRKSTQIPALHAAWLKRIQQENIKRELGAGGRDSRKPGQPDAEISPEYEKFLTETVPQLQWEMELDLFNAGDESGAAVRMLAHIEKHIAHPSARQWGEQFKALLTPKAAP